MPKAIGFRSPASAGWLLLSIMLVGCGHSGSDDPNAPAPVRADIKVLQDSMGDPSMPYARYYDRLTITAIADKVEIDGISINRGHCSDKRTQLPATLAYGQQISFDPNCSVLEVTVDTDQGSWTMNFDQH